MSVEESPVMGAAVVGASISQQLIISKYIIGERGDPPAACRQHDAGISQVH